MTDSMIERMQAISILDVEGDAYAVRDRREEAARGALELLWRRKWRIAVALLVGELLAVGWLVFAPPKYASTAVVEFGFGSVPTMSSGSEQGVDANSVVESAALILRSRDVATSVVDALGLDQDPGFTHRSRFDRLLEGLRERVRSVLDDGSEMPERLKLLLGQAFLIPERPNLSPRELAANELLQRLSIAHEPHTYVVSITATDADPVRSSAIANAVAGQYLRLERRLGFNTRRGEIEREIADLTAKFGDSHPSVVRAKERFAALKEASESSSPASEQDAFAAGRYVHAAEPVDLPSSPNPKTALQVGAALSIAAGMVWALAGLRERLTKQSKRRRPQQDAKASVKSYSGNGSRSFR